MSNYSDPKWMNRAKWMTQALIISGTLNIGFLATVFSFILKDKHSPVAFEFKPAEERQHAKDVPVITNNDILQRYSTQSFSELLIKLENKDFVEEGYTRRDLALACLVAFHYFNLERALGGLNVQQRQVMFTNPTGDEKIDLTIFPGLADYQYQAILQYAKTEKWPLISKGLFYELKEKKSLGDPTLYEAFYLAPEFHIIAAFFSRSGVSVNKELLVEMLSDGEWEFLFEFANQQRQAQDVSAERRRTFLLNYLDCKSKIAAKLLLQTDAEFSAKRLDDHHIILFLELIDEKTPSLYNFAKELLISPRSDEVLKAASKKLYDFVGESISEPYDHSVSLKRFFPELLEALETVEKTASEAAQPPQILPSPPPPPQMHIVQPGDSLWKIAKKYGVSIDSITKLNRLESEKLRIGRRLQIPLKRVSTNC